MKVSSSHLILLIVVLTTACSSGSNAPETQPKDETGATQSNPLDDVKPSEPEPSEPEPSEPPNAVPAAPLALKGVVYTDTEIELFWEPSEDLTVVSYRIRRDGIELKTVDALSFYDNTVLPGTTYDYTVVSVASSGEVSTPVSQMLTTPSAAPTINLRNAEELLAHVLDVASGATFGDALNLAVALGDVVANNTAGENGFIELSNESTSEIERKTYDCEFSGQLSATRTYNALPSGGGVLTQCNSGLRPATKIDGQFYAGKQLSKFVFNTGISTDLSLTEFALTNDDGERRVLTGLYYEFDGIGQSWAFKERAETQLDENSMPLLNEDGTFKNIVTPFSYRSPAFEGQTEIHIKSIARRRGEFASIDSTAGSNDWMHTLDASYTIQSPVTGNKRIDVSTPIEFFTDQKGECFSAGELKLTAADGSQLVLDADTGDSATITVSVTADGQTSNQTYPWFPLYAHLHTTPEQIARRVLSGSDIPGPLDCNSAES